MIKTVFGEEIKVNDEVMYIYKSNGEMLICFGKVLELKYVKKQYYHGLQPIMHVHKTSEISYNKLRSCDKNVILTNPTIFKCGTKLQYPKSK